MGSLKKPALLGTIGARTALERVSKAALADFVLERVAVVVGKPPTDVTDKDLALVINPVLARRGDKQLMREREQEPCWVPWLSHWVPGSIQEGPNELGQFRVRLIGPGAATSSSVWFEPEQIRPRNQGDHRVLPLEAGK